MHLIDEQFLETPFYGVRQMTWHLRAERRLVNEKRIRQLMRLIGLMPIYQRPNTSRKAKGHKTWPFLLRGLVITRPNQVWCADVTYIPMRRGSLYVVAIMHWATRKCWPGGCRTRWRPFVGRPHWKGRFALLTLCRSPERGAHPVRTAGDQEHGSGQPIHILDLDRPAVPCGRENLDGRNGPALGQHFRRASLAQTAHTGSVEKRRNPTGRSNL